MHWSIARQVSVAWLLTLPAAAAFGAVSAWVAATGPVGTIVVVVLMIGLAGGIYAASRRRRVTADNVNDVHAPSQPRGLSGGLTSPGTAVAAVCLLDAAAIVSYGLYLLVV